MRPPARVFEGAARRLGRPGEGAAAAVPATGASWWLHDTCQTLATRYLSSHNVQTRGGRPRGWSGQAGEKRVGLHGHGCRVRRLRWTPEPQALQAAHAKMHGPGAPPMCHPANPPCAAATTSQRMPPISTRACKTPPSMRTLQDLHTKGKEMRSLLTCQSAGLTMGLLLFCAAAEVRERLAAIANAWPPFSDAPLAATHLAWALAPLPQTRCVA